MLTFSPQITIALFQFPNLKLSKMSSSVAFRQSRHLSTAVRKIPGGVTATQGFKAAGMYGGLRAVGEKPDLALVTCEVDAICAGAFTTNVVAAAPVVYCKSPRPCD